MTSLEDVWGTGHGISSPHPMSSITGIRVDPTLPRLGTDISGAYAYINQPVPQYRPDPFRKEDVSLQAEEIIGKYRNFETMLKECKDRKKELTDTAKSLDKHRDDLWRHRNSLHNLLFCTGVATQEEFQAVLDAKKACRAAEDIIEKKLREKWQIELRKLDNDIGYAEINLKAIHEYMAVSVRSLIPEGQARANMCPICYEKEINRCCVPCGHTLCSTCSSKAGSECVTCRGHIEKTIPLYFSI